MTEGNKRRIKHYFTLLAIFSLTLAQAQGLSAQELTNGDFRIKIDKATISKGYTVEAFNRNLRLSLVPGILKEATDVHIIDLKEDLPANGSTTMISDPYQFEFLNKKAYDDKKPFYIQMSYEKADNYLKQVYFFDKTVNSWRPLPTKDFPKEKFVRSLIHLPFARIAVFSNPKIMTVGQASWYVHKSGDFAASPDFPDGTILRVTNQANDKYVDVEVNDFGPDRTVHPGRVVDLEKNAFAKLGSLQDGTIKVAIEVMPKKAAVAEKPQAQVLGLKKTADVVAVKPVNKNQAPEVTLKAAMVMNQKTGEVIWEKNSSSIMPLASLTKIVAIDTFLETGPSLDTVVTYSQQDEDYNYAYADKSVVARLKVKDGETMTVKDLIYSSLVGSANNAVESLVRVSGLSRPDFLARMNRKVANWGAKSTKFFEPTGLDPNNVSSPRDYAIIAREALKNSTVAKASSIPSYVFATINTKIKHTIKNTDKIIASEDFDVVGSKTGYLDEAGYCLMTSVKEGNSHIIVVTFGAATRAKSFSETSDLIEYGLSRLN